MAKFVAFFILIMTLVACDQQQGDSPAVVELPPTATLLPIPGQLPQDTATPVPSRTPLPTFTFTPTESPVPPTETLSPTPTITPTIGGIVQSVNRVNVREGPGTTFSAVDALDAGTGIQILGKNDEAGAWLNIRLEDGTEGWISSRLVRLVPTPTTLPTLTPSPDLTALALGTPLPTAVLGGGTLTPTPPLSVITATPVGAVAQAAEVTLDADAPTATATADFLPIIPFPDVNLSSINMTATALVSNAASLTPSFTPEAGSDDENRVITLEPTPEPTDEEDSAAVDSNATLVAAAASLTPDENDNNEIPVVTQVGEDDDDNTPVPTATIRPRSGVRVFAFCDNGAYGVAKPPPIPAGSDIQIYWAWFARTVAQVNDHIENANFELRLNGEVIEVLDEYRREIGREGVDYVAYWYIPVESLAAGDYEITYSVTWDEAITDGYASYGPDTGTPFEQETCNFEVR